MQTFSLNPPINLSEVVLWLLEVTAFEATNSVLKITYEKKNLQLPPRVIGLPEVERRLLTDYKNF